MLNFRKEFEPRCKEKFANDSKIGLLCSVAPDGCPHIALISSLSVKDGATLMWGQFSMGLSKAYLKDNPKTGFLVLSPAGYEWWTGKARYTGSARSGADFDYFNNKPLFRYNSYFGFGAVHYEALVDVSAGEKLPFIEIALGFLQSGLLARRAGNAAAPEKRLPPYGMRLAGGLGGLRFVAFVDGDGFPRVYPALQGRAANENTLVFSARPYGGLLGEIPDGARAAVFMANMELESLLLQGRWRRLGGVAGGPFRGAAFDIERVYNSMLPIGGYIYPPRPIPNVYGAK